MVALSLQRGYGEGFVSEKEDVPHAEFRIVLSVMDSQTQILSRDVT